MASGECGGLKVLL